MPRPSRNTDRLLIQAARELLPKTGCSGLNIRQVAKHAGVNLGMFHYHFKTKEEFIRIVLQEFYEEMFQKLQLNIDPALPPIQNLRRAMITIATFFRDHRDLVFPLIKDIFQGEVCALRFAIANFPRHISLIAELVAKCQEQGALRKTPLIVLMSLFVSSIAGPILAATAGEHSTKSTTPLAALLKESSSLLLSDEIIALRVDMVLKGASV